ncbi:MAG: tetratricopeptide repeat protein [Gemmatimonadales bacterium]
MKKTLRIAVILAAFVAGPPVHAQQPSGVEVDPALAAADSLEKAGDHAAAMKVYEAIAGRHPNEARYWDALGLSAGQAREYAKGADAFAKAASISASSVSMYNAAAMHARLGHNNEAFQWIDKSVKAGFYLPELLNTDDDMASIRSDTRFPAALAAAREALIPCAKDPDARRFDFWVGEWKLTGANGRPAGTSSIQLVSGQCALLENFTNTNGTTGKSLNAYNPQTRNWQQFWVGQLGGVTEYRSSTWEGNSLVFLSHSMKPDGSPQLIRLAFTPLAPDKVRQFAQTSDDDGKTWQRSYDIIYDRKK